MTTSGVPFPSRSADANDRGIPLPDCEAFAELLSPRNVAGICRPFSKLKKGSPRPAARTVTKLRDSALRVAKFPESNMKPLTKVTRSEEHTSELQSRFGISY